MLPSSGSNWRGSTRKTSKPESQMPPRPLAGFPETRRACSRRALPACSLCRPVESSPPARRSIAKSPSACEFRCSRSLVGFLRCGPNSSRRKTGRIGWKRTAAARFAFVGRSHARRANRGSLSRGESTPSCAVRTAGPFSTGSRTASSASRQSTPAWKSTEARWRSIAAPRRRSLARRPPRRSSS